MGLGLEPVEDEQVDTADERFGLVADDFGVGDVRKKPGLAAGKRKPIVSTLPWVTGRGVIVRSPTGNGPWMRCGAILR